MGRLLTILAGITFFAAACGSLDMPQKEATTCGCAGCVAMAGAVGPEPDLEKPHPTREEPGTTGPAAYRLVREIDIQKYGDDGVTSPGGLAFNKQTREFWVGEWYDNQLTRISYANGLFAGQVNISTVLGRGYDESTGLAWVDGELWHTDGLGKFFKIDPDTGKFLKQMNLGWPDHYGRNPWGLTYDGSYFWYVDNNTDRIYKIDANGKLLDSIDAHRLVAFDNPNPSGIDYYDGSLWVTFDNAAAGGKVYRIDPAEKIVVGCIQLGNLTGTSNMGGIKWVDGSLWINNSSGGNRLQQYAPAD